MHPILITGASGRVGRVVVDQLLATGVPVRALTRRPTETGLPPVVEVASGDLSDKRTVVKERLQYPSSQ